MLSATPESNERRKVVIAYDGLDVGRQMLTWAAKFCLAADDELFLLQYQVSCMALVVVLQTTCSNTLLPTLDVAALGMMQLPGQCSFLDGIAPCFIRVWQAVILPSLSCNSLKLMHALGAIVESA